jgi:hypothetical protein
MLAPFGYILEANDDDEVENQVFGLNTECFSLVPTIDEVLSTRSFDIYVSNFLATFCFDKVSESLLTTIIIIDQIKYLDQNVKGIFLDQIDKCFFSGQILLLEELFESNIYWRSKYLSQISDIEGQYCTPIKSETLSNGSLVFTRDNLTSIKSIFEGIVKLKKLISNQFKAIKFTYSDEYLLDSLQLQCTNDELQSYGPQFKCHYCSILIKKEYMRLHIAGHFFNNHLPIDVNLCGFCGLVGCSISYVIKHGIITTLF